MAIKWELSAITGTYTNRDGEEKKSYVRCGVVMETKKGGLVAKLEALPVNFDGWMFMNEPRPKETQKQETNNNPVSEVESDIPF